jgi:hypothetical protein
MGRGKAKGKKSTTNAIKNKIANNEETTVQPVRKRGRPQKPSKDELNLEKSQIVELKEEHFDTKPKEEIKEVKGKMKGGDNSDLTDEENGSGFMANGFRPIGSRRKNKHPKRAAGVGIAVECN